MCVVVVRILQLILRRLLGGSQGNVFSMIRQNILMFFISLEDHCNYSLLNAK